jgi:hypothetical protein
VLVVVQAETRKEQSAMQTSGDANEDGNPGNISVRAVLSQSGPHHSFQHRLDDYRSIMDDEYDDRVVAEAKSSSRLAQPQQRKSFEDTTHTVSSALGQYAKSSSSLSDMSKEVSPASLNSSAAKSVQSSAADEKSSPSSGSNVAAGFGSKAESPGASSRFHVARPHHLPKMASLSGNLDKIRMSMGEEVRDSVTVVVASGTVA